MPNTEMHVNVQVIDNPNSKQNESQQTVSTDLTQQPETSQSAANTSATANTKSNFF